MLSAGFEHGGNTLHRFLDGHPSLKVYPFESMVGTPASQNLLVPSTVPFRYGWPSFDSELPPREAYNLFYDEEMKTYLRTPNRSKFKDCGMEMDEKEREYKFSVWAKFLNNAEEEGRVKIRANYVEAYFHSTFESWKNYKYSNKETHYVGYNPMVHLDADKIFSDFPDAHMVYVSRNPWSAYADTLKRPFPYSLEKYCQVWNVAQMQALNYANKYPGQFHLFRNEDLFVRPRVAMASLLDGLELPWSENVLYPSFNGKRLETMYPWGTLKRFDQFTNRDTANELCELQKEFISRECYSMLNAWSYCIPQ